MRLLTGLLLAGLLAMHGFTANHDGEMPAMVKAPMAASMAGPSLAPHPVHPIHPILAQAPALPGHGGMELCVAVIGLALVLLFLAGARHAERRGSLDSLRSVIWRAAGRGPPPHLRPSLTGLCIARV
jgi:hypothetical protein